MLIRSAQKRMIPILAAMMLLMWVILSALTGVSLYGKSAYNSYTLQALSWLQGKVTVENVWHLELAVYQDEYYVSFPPLPSVILLPFTLIFGVNTPDNALVKCYACLAVILIYKALCARGYDPSVSAPYAFLFAFSSSLLSLTVEGAVWYHAQVLAFLLTTAAVSALIFDKPTWALFLIALSVACRPFDALYLIPVIFAYVYLELRSGEGILNVFRRLLPGILLGLLVAFAIGTYNYARFKSPFEFGHNYLPEFSTQGGVQFSLSKVPEHINPFVIGLPFSLQDGVLKINRFGFSFLIACPALLILIVMFVRDLFTRRLNAMKTVLFITFFVHLFLLFMHRTFGAFQYGARYCVDLMPYAFFYRLMDDKNSVHKLEWGYLLCTFALSFYGSAMIHL